jgi:cytidylate kinase
VASAEERARRRALEEAMRAGADDPATQAQAAVESTRASLQARDERDSGRAVSPLTKAADAVEVDATSMTLPEVIDHVVALAARAAAHREAGVRS